MKVGKIRINEGAKAPDGSNRIMQGKGISGMKKRWKNGCMLAALFLLILFSGIKTEAASKAADISLICSKVTISKGKSVELKQMISPAAMSRKKIVWKSSNKTVARVDASGRVTGLKTGSAVITARTAQGKKASCKVKVAQGNHEYVINTTAGPQTYIIYDQSTYGYYIAQMGCVTTAVAAAASHYGLKYSPLKIHTAPASAKYGERYAVRKMPGSTRLYGRAAISVAAASRILKNMGIENTAVYKFKPENAIRQIKEYARQGKPVLVKVTNRTYKGLRIAGGHHMLILVGLDPEGYGIFIESYGGKLNFAHMSGKYFKMKISTLVNEYMKPAAGNYKNSYVTSMSGAGGYILIDGK